MAAQTDPGRGYHDLGGTPAGPVDPRVSEAKPWEKLAVALSNVLGRRGKGLICTDETRRTREEMGADLYHGLDYFERHVEALRAILVEKEILDADELERRMAAIERRIAEAGR